MMQGRPSATSGDLVSRLHALHQQRNERLDTLRAEVDRQRRDKEDAMASSTRFRATPIKTGAGGASSGGDGRRVEDRLISFGRDKQRRTSQKAETAKKQEAVHNFSPQINKKSRAAAGGRSVAAMHDWEAQRRMKLEEKRRARAEAEVAGAPFRPSISPAAKKMQPAVPVHSRLHEVRLSVLTCVFAALTILSRLVGQAAQQSHAAKKERRTEHHAQERARASSARPRPRPRQRYR